MMNLKEIKEMINLMNENGLQELEVEKDGMRIKLRKSQIEHEAANGAIIVEKQSLSAAPRQHSTESTSQANDNSVEIKAPMVGTFYRAPSPEAPPYSEVGQKVEVGQVICIIEAMKLMNEIKSEIRGKIVEILIDNAEPVEFGQAMFLVEP
ncbi:MAG: acetyl-CoA carboxylase biotin carboxyl carrier protein [Candidatus Omnitrophota bacterium]